MHPSRRWLKFQVKMKSLSLFKPCLAMAAKKPQVYLVEQYSRIVILGIKKKGSGEALDVGKKQR